MKLSVCVAGHPKRIDLIKRLAARLDLSPDRLTIDYKSNGCYVNMKKAWANIAAEATHQLVIQDDVLLCADFIAAVHIIIKRFPSRKIYLFNPQRNPDPTPMFIEQVCASSSQCVVMPVKMVYSMLMWDAKFMRDDGSTKFHSDDIHWNLWEAHNNIHPLVVNPSLAQHLYHQKKDSLIKDSISCPQSNTFLGEDISGLTVNWNEARLVKRNSSETLRNLLKTYGYFVAS